ncbi:LAMI_0A00188g1_1 [Lachancea mirantina]|uniref:LAMI_0A00188g1_1 n=1 Tax=Lachancea mirantina TaxID=1230905 RepID=A0A1G4IL68_9SACH|nr:LAMI_0A00188g1_1 [Lachancea mirantina]
MNSQLKHIFKAVKGIRIHYVTAGRKSAHLSPIILLAGFPESWYAWRKVIPQLTEFFVIAIDLPGQGDSDKPSDGYDTSTIADLVHGLIENLGLSRYHLAAHDVGAWVAFSYALKFSEEIDKLALLDAGIPGVTLPEMLPTSPEGAWRLWHFPFHAVPDLPELMIRDKERIYLEWFLRRKAADPTIFTEADLDEYERIFMQPGALRAGLSYYRACGKSAQQNKDFLKKSKLASPLLAVSSDQGSIPSMASSLEAFSGEVEDVTIEDCGHFITEEQPQRLAAELKRFFFIAGCEDSKLETRPSINTFQFSHSSLRPLVWAYQGYGECYD